MNETIFFKSHFGGKLPAILHRPVSADTIFVLGHGSGSTIHVPLMAALSKALAYYRIATLRFEYPYSSNPNFVPYSDMPVDTDEVLVETVREALKYCLQKYPELKALVGGHSISGLATTYADAKTPLQATGIICIGYPRKGDPSRSQHLANTSAPLLFIQGTNDALGSQREIEEMNRPLGDRATMKWINGASHGFGVEGRKLSDVASEIAEAVRLFADHI